MPHLQHLSGVPTFEQQGGLVPLNDFSDGASYIAARTGPSASVYKPPDGKYYQMPWKSNPVMIFYNKKEFAKAGLSTTNPPLSSYSQFLCYRQEGGVFWCGEVRHLPGAVE